MTWPKKDLLIRHAVVVLGVTLVFALGFWLLDGGMRALISQYIVTTTPFRGTGSTMTGSTMSGATIPQTDMTTIPVSTSLPSGINVTPVTTTTEVK